MGRFVSCADTPHYATMPEVPYRIMERYGKTAFDGTLKYFVLLREPVARTISSWEFKFDRECFLLGAQMFFIGFPCFGVCFCWLFFLVCVFCFFFARCCICVTLALFLCVLVLFFLLLWFLVALFLFLLVVVVMMLVVLLIYCFVLFSFVFSNIFAETLVWVRFFVVCFLYKTNPNPRESSCCGKKKVGPNAA